MTIPVEPNLDPSLPPVSSPGGQGNMDDEVRQLAAALAPDDVTAMSGHKATIDSIDMGNATTPPTVQINLGGVLIPNVAIAANYSPQVGDTVVLAKQGNSYVALFRIAALSSALTASNTEGGWTQATLNASHSHFNSDQPVMYRRVLDHGAWKMQWQGALNYGGSTSLLASALPAEFRPHAGRNCPVTRSVTGGAALARIDFATGGTATFAGVNTTAASAGSHSHSLGTSDTRLSGYLSQGGSDLGHAHGLGSSSTDGSHTHSISDPPWISLDGVEYFL